ncbi:hypothetical protein D9756_010097 [Leucocoprinus leucothites]|uniref:PH domain-containing protein n=1 Tax=Leucocoprinus leucothites TaxID=201217 RepID=A0A8H5CTR6_9AGAR|nr:hypothetical protein D9756_010097 [Leucoagaricus leucothites]
MSSSTPGTTTIPSVIPPAVMVRTNTMPGSSGGGGGGNSSSVVGEDWSLCIRLNCWLLYVVVWAGDPALIHPFLTEIGKDRRASVDTSGSESGMNTAAAALHLAVRCASTQTVQLLLSHRAISPNGVHPPGSGTTPLHLAASLGRADIVSLLLEQEDVDDTVRDGQGRTCRDVAKGREVIKLIDDSRSFLNASYRSLLRSYILSPTTEPPSQLLISLLSSPRASLVDLSYLDDASGTSLLHEAAKRKDLRLIELAVRAGADVFVRNRRGKMAMESAGKDDKVRVFLRQFANHDRSLIQTPVPTMEPPALKGYLNKYTNVARGYNTRWFVLAHGVLSYYRHQDDESIASRGSISMKNAHLKASTSTSITSSSSKSSALRFEIHSDSSSSQQKWYIKANHPTEAARWISAIRSSIEWYKRDGYLGTPNLTAGGLSTPNLAGNVPAVVVEGEMGRRASGESHSDSRSVYSFSKSKRPQAITRTSTLPYSISRGAGGGDTDSINAALSGDPYLSDAPAAGGGAGEGEEDDDDMETSSADTGAHRAHVPPHEAEYELGANGVVVQLEAVQQLLARYLGSLSPPTSSAPPIAQSNSQLAPPPAISASSSRSIGTSITSSSSSSSNRSSYPHPQQQETQHAILSSMQSLSSLLTQHFSMASSREQWYKKALAAERKRQTVWEESLATVVREGAMLEEELKVRKRRRGSRVFSSSGEAGGTGGGRRRSTVRPSVVMRMAGVEGVPEEAVDGENPIPERRVLDDSVVVGSPTPQAETQLSSFFVPPPQQQQQQREPKRERTTDTIRIDTASKQVAEEEEEEDGYDDSEDEFFDAIESNNLPGLIIPAQFSGKPMMSPADLPPYVSTLAYQGYKDLRTVLEISDERPPTSLWSVLKHSIGKDLTRISFPVFFNEPTSMLQRMAEDMEFSECLDTAVTQRDSLKRLAFVAAFAMSNYSSTIGRIAKPFNPMLSETFEYVRLDKKYRYVSEQVSHHPPISACWAESPLWHYFGEVDAQNKFMGKSFEIRPTGVAHAELLIPESWVDGNGKYPKAKGVMGEGKVVEHYTWKKVTTNVSGFILGSPTIDHYGDMIITNHRTNERCILTFKPRGWRGKDAYEISGQVIDERGRTVYEIAGRWNSQLIMREVGSGHEGALNPDTSISSPASTIRSPVSPIYQHSHSHQPHTHGEYILLWKNSLKPPGSPFNLTPFAISLNHCPPQTLRPYLPPSDCRLRPDQRAFELGKYDLANDLKGEQEERQRRTRREREMGMREGHRARWFESRTCVDTGERVWMPKRVSVRMRVEGGGRESEKGREAEAVVEEERVEYWVERERVWREVEEGGEKEEDIEDGDGQGRWKDVEEIFVQEPDIIRELVRR